MSDTTIELGSYRTRAGLTVRIVGLHPRLDGVLISDKWSESNPGAYWYETGIHPHNDENDLMERLPEAG